MTDNALDLVLVSPGSRVRLYQGLGRTLTAVEPPVWAGLIATAVRSHGFSVEIVDAEADDLTPAETAARIVDEHPRLVAVVVYGHQPSASTQNMTGASAIVSALKARSPATPVLMLGGHVAALPERTLDEEACDFVARDEGVLAVVDLIAALRERDTDLRKIRGLGYRQEGRAVLNPAAPLLMDLDRQLPGVAWDLLPMPRYRAHNWHCFGNRDRQPYASMYTTLGCPYHCAFCCIQAPFKSGEHALGLTPRVNSYRFWSPERVVAELDRLANDYGVRNIKLADEMFVLNERHVTGICDAIVERGYDLNLWAYGRVDTVTDRMLDKLKRAGFNWLAFGIEAGNEQVLTAAGKGYRIELAHRTVEKVKAAGINVIGNFIFGLPDDSEVTMQETLDLALDLRCEFVNLNVAMAYPGSALYGEALRLGWRLPAAWSGYSQHAVDTLPLPTRSLSAGDVLRFRDRAFQRYFTDEAYLDMVRRRFGDATVAHVRDMVSHPLERRNAS
jgi:radical SAM superfamily enzyme YgiQ (UPF0313 family)